MKIYEILEQQLKRENNYKTDNGELKKWVIINKAQNNDAELIELLLGNAELKEKFFIAVKDVLVFNQSLFIQFLEQKNYLNDSYTLYKNKIGLNIDGKYLKQRNEVALVWPYKDCILEGGQTHEEDSREEIFFNEILAQDEINQLLEPKVLTNAKRYTANGEQPFDTFNRNEEGTITDNLIIKGNNLLALHSLKQEFAEKVKLIYFDPPYNTGGSNETFTYNNSFNHSTWLTFIKNRLESAKGFLREDGFIVITIDHEELFYIGALADEIFGRENRAGIISVIINPKGRQNEKYLSAICEYMLIYAKNAKRGKFRQVVLDEAVAAKFDLEDESGKFKYENFINARTRTLRTNRPNHWYPIYVSNNLEKIELEPIQGYYELYPIASNKEYSWKLIKNSSQEKLNSDYFKAIVEDGKIQILHKFREQQRINNVWTHKKYFAEFNGTNLLKKILGENIFSYPKSLYAVIDTLKLITDEEDIILDFFAGSGTTGHATIQLNKDDGGSRQFILVEQLEEHLNVIKDRMSKIIKINSDNNTLYSSNEDENIVYFELKKYNQTFIERIETVETTEELLTIWEDMKARSFLNYNVDLKKQDAHIEEFKNLSIAEQKQHLCCLLDKNQLYVNLSSLNDTDFEVNEEEKRITEDFYQLHSKQQ